MNLDLQPPDPVFDLEKWWFLFIVYGLVLLGIYILWSVIEWLLKRNLAKEKEKKKRKDEKQ